MWIKNITVIWISIHTDKNRHFHFTFPAPLFVIQELLDCFLDLLNFACLFKPKRKFNSDSLPPVYAAREILLITIKLLYSLQEAQPYELIHLSADGVRVSVKVS